MSSTLQVIMPLAAIVEPIFDRIIAVVFIVGILVAAYKKIISPGAAGITTFNEDFAPNVKYMKHLSKLDKMMSVIEEIAAQFRSDSGSTLKDDINNLGENARENREAAAIAAQAAEIAQQAAIDAKTALDEFARSTKSALSDIGILMGTAKEHAKDERELARDDRDLARDALKQIHELVASGVLAAESRARTEASGARVEAASAVVAEDLAATQKRADDVQEHEPPGTAADAASQSPEE